MTDKKGAPKPQPKPQPNPDLPIRIPAKPGTPEGQ